MFMTCSNHLSPTVEYINPEIIIHSLYLFTLYFQVHDMLYNSANTSPHDDSSASDSGKGPSEEGDHMRENPEELEMADFRCK